MIGMPGSVFFGFRALVDFRFDFFGGVAAATVFGFFFLAGTLSFVGFVGSLLATDAFFDEALPTVLVLVGFAFASALFPFGAFAFGFAVVLLLITFVPGFELLLLAVVFFFWGPVDLALGGVAGLAGFLACDMDADVPLLFVFFLAAVFTFSAGFFLVARVVFVLAGFIGGKVQGCIRRAAGNHSEVSVVGSEPLPQ